MPNARGVGALNASPDSDGVLRRVPVLLRLGAQTVPSLSAEALRVAQGTPNYLVRSTAAGVQEVRIGQVTVPTNAQGELWLHYTRKQPDRVVSVAHVLDGTVPAAQLRGHIVLVGSSAAGLMDIRSTPMAQQMPGVQAHAMALEQMLSGQYLQRPAWAMLLVFRVARGLQHRVTERQQRWLRTAFSRYVSPNRVNYLVAHPEQLHLGGKRQVCSFVFTDLAGFTPMLEASDPAPLVSLLNDYLEAMLVIVFQHEGTLDRFVGDAMVVLFSAPGSVCPRLHWTAAPACRCAAWGVCCSRARTNRWTLRRPTPH